MTVIVGQTLTCFVESNPKYNPMLHSFPVIKHLGVIDLRLTNQGNKESQYEINHMFLVSHCMVSYKWLILMETKALSCLLCEILKHM